MNPNDNQNGKNGGNDNNRQPIIVLILLSLVALFITSFIYNAAGSRSTQEISYSKFLSLVEEDKVKSVTFTSDKVNITLKDGASISSDDKQTEESFADSYFKATGQSLKVTYYTVYLNDPDLLPLLKEHKVEIKAEGNDNTYAIIMNVLSFVIPLVLLWVIFGVFMRRMGNGTFGVGKSNAKVYVEKSTGVTFADVAGQDEAKESLTEVVDFLHNPQKYKMIGARLPKGALLVGPPGTGKTLLAKAVAGEAGVPFFSLAGSDFVEMFVGVGASRVRDLFAEAQKAAPCIIFIDEIDAIGKSRDSRYGGGNDEREQTLNQLLTEMDGFEGNTGVIILAATNRPESLDPALLRPGRFDRRVPVELPDLQGREAILKVHAKKVRLSDNVNLHTIARMASGASGAELANIINEAALRAVRAGRKVANQEDLEESVEVVIAGYQKKNAVLTDREKCTVAYHEIGHALVSALQSNAAPVQKITIIPRTSGALGYTLQVEERDKYLMSKEDLLTRICTLTAGRAAEEVEFGVITTGASNDIEQATKLARAMITQYGMDDDFDMVAFDTRNNRYLDDSTTSSCSPATQEDIDRRVISIVKTQHEKAKELLRANMDKLNELSQYLYEKETITGEEFMRILNAPSKYKSLPDAQA